METNSLIPPTPEKVVQGVTDIANASLDFGVAIAQQIVDFVTNLFKLIV